MSGDWGIFQSGGGEVFTPDSFIGMRASNSFSISNYPIEEGAFGSYNKVADPYRLQCTIAVSGIDSKQEVIDSCFGMLQSTDFFTVVTPDEAYPMAELVSYNYSRGPDTGSMVIINLTFQELRLVSGAKRTTASASNSGATSSGSVQTTSSGSTGTIQ